MVLANHQKLAAFNDVIGSPLQKGIVLVGVVGQVDRSNDALVEFSQQNAFAPGVNILAAIANHPLATRFGYAKSHILEHSIQNVPDHLPAFALAHFDLDGHPPVVQVSVDSRSLPDVGSPIHFSNRHSSIHKNNQKPSVRKVSGVVV